VAGVLHELGVVKTTVFAECGGAAVLSDGMPAFKQLLEKSADDGGLGDGGVLFIDEAYQLNPKTDKTGAQIVNYLLKTLEDRRNELVCIVAGYGDQMDELFGFNPGLPSRFPHQFVFEDFSYKELHAILFGILKEKRYRFEAPKPLRIAARRLAAGRGTPGFGNGRAVRTYFESAVRRQQDRLAAARSDGAVLGDAVNVLTKADLLGPCQMPESLPAVAELEAMVGLAAVKKQVRSMLAMMSDNLVREANEEQPLQISLNRLFLGNPGAYGFLLLCVHTPYVSL
jgi:hypothetical protein